MGKNRHFRGQQLYGPVIKSIDKSKNLRFSHTQWGGRYTKRFNCWIHLVVILYSMICVTTHCAR